MFKKKIGIRENIKIQNLLSGERILWLKNGESVVVGVRARWWQTEGDGVATDQNVNPTF